MFSAKLIIIALLIGTAFPPLAALEVIKIADLSNAVFWLGILTVAISSFAATSLTVLSILAGSNTTLNAFIPKAPSGLPRE